MSANLASTKSERPKLTIGQRVWNGYSEYVVVGETSRSWPSAYEWVESSKLPKSKPLDDRWCLTEEAWEDWKYASSHRRWIANKIENTWQTTINGKVLRQIAELIGYDPEKDMPERVRAKR